VQQVIQEETNVTSVTDPLAGSYYVEALTDQIAEAALALVDDIEAQGGYIAAQRSGWIRSVVEDSAERWRGLVDSGERRIVGLNCYRVEEEEQQPIFTVDPEVERIAVERVQQLRATRDAAAYERAIAALDEAASDFATREVNDLGDDRLMQATIDAARADATTGEIMAVLKGRLGWGSPHEF
jgi:methylmalonyl-CoA mutase cobalamin-binding domain/chain